MTIDELRSRLSNYPGAHSGEDWKLETDLNKCTDREKAEITRLGFTIEDLMKEGFNRGEVQHMLFGYKFTRR